MTNYVERLDYSNIVFPVAEKQYYKIEKHYYKIEKQSSIRINVFGYEERQPFPIHDQMKLLLITKDEKKHYVLIKDFNKFTYNQSKHKERKHFCMCIVHNVFHQKTS